MHYPSAFSEAFAEARGEGEKRQERATREGPLLYRVSGGGDEPSPQVPAESDD